MKKLLLIGICILLSATLVSSADFYDYWCWELNNSGGFCFEGNLLYPFSGNTFNFNSTLNSSEGFSTGNIIINGTNDEITIDGNQVITTANGSWVNKTVDIGKYLTNDTDANFGTIKANTFNNTDQNLFTDSDVEFNNLTVSDYINMVNSISMKPANANTMDFISWTGNMRYRLCTVDSGVLTCLAAIGKDVGMDVLDIIVGAGNWVEFYRNSADGESQPVIIHGEPTGTTQCNIATQILGTGGSNTAAQLNTSCTDGIKIDNDVNVTGTSHLVNATFSGDIPITLLNTTWEDINIGVITLGDGVNAPTKTDWNTTGIQVNCFAGSVQNDYVSGCLEFPHNWKEESEIHPHLHWAKSATGAGNVVWNVSYFLSNQDGGDGLYGDIGIVQAVSGSKWNMTYADFGGIDTTGYNLGSQFCFKLQRSQNDPSDTYSDGYACPTTIGVHYQIDSLGSRDELVK